MPLPNAARWAALRPRIDALLTLPPLQRARALEALAANDPDTAMQLEALLRSRDEALQTAPTPLIDLTPPPAAAESALRFGPQSRLGGGTVHREPGLDSEAGAFDTPSLQPLHRPPSPQRGRAGDTLGRWTLITPLGEDSGSGLWRVHAKHGLPPETATQHPWPPEWVMRLWHMPSNDPVSRARWREQGKRLMDWQHPLAARVLDVDLSPSGQPYVVLERLRGERIDHWCNAHDRQPRERVHLFLTLLAVMADAHAHLQLHLDLHPGQVVIDDNGQLRVAGIGMVPLLGPAAPRPNPEYTAPEHFHGAAPCVSADIYALGVMLYELLTHQHPIGHSEATPREYLRAAAEGRFLPPSQARPGLRRSLGPDMDAILARALDPQPTHRYASVASFAEDLQHWLRGESLAADAPPLLAHSLSSPTALAAPSVTPTRSLWTRWLHRRPAWVLGGLGLVGIGVVGLGVSAVQAHQAKREERQAREALVQAEGSSRQAWSEFASVQDLDMLHRMLLAQLASAPDTPAGKLLRQVGQQLNNADGLSPARRVALLTALGEEGLAGLAPPGDADTQALLNEAYSASLPLGLPALRARAGCGLGAALGSAGQVDAGLKLTEQALQDLPAVTTKAQATQEPGAAASRVACLLRQTDLLQRSGRADDSGLASAQLAAQALPFVPSPREAMEMEVHLHLAEAHGRAGQVGEALAGFERVANQLKAQGQQQSTTATRVRAGLAQWSLVAGRPSDALAQLATPASYDQVRDGLLPTARVALLRGQAELARGQWSAALASAEQARQAALERNDVGLQRQARVLQLQALRAQGATGQAMALLPGAWALLGGASPAEQGQEARLRMTGAQLAQDQGEAALARQLADQAVNTALAGPAGQLALPRLLLQRAELHLKQDDTAAARADADRALALWTQQLGSTLHSANLGEALLFQARLQALQGAEPDSRQTAGTALLHLERTLGPDHPLTLAARAAANGNLKALADVPRPNAAPRAPGATQAALAGSRSADHGGVNGP